MYSINNLKKFLKRGIYTLYRLQENVDDSKILQGKILAELNKSRFHLFKENIQLAEFKVFSQWGDDGIIEFLVSYLDIPEKSFIEFGVEDYTESNTRFLLINHNWRGLILDGNRKDIDYILDDEICWKHTLTARHAFITKENINQLIQENRFSGELGLLHIDIDGNDYESSWVMQYNPSHQWKYNSHMGSSLKALEKLGHQQGYKLVGCSFSGVNAFFVREDLLADHFCSPFSAENHYEPARYFLCSQKAGHPRAFGKFKTI